MPLTMQEKVQDFLKKGPYAVLGASNNRTKFGNKILRAYLVNHLKAYPIHPTEPLIEGQKVYQKLADLPEAVEGLSIITPPAVTEKIIVEAHQAGISRLWMQPGAESEKAVKEAEDRGMSVIWGGPCLLVVLGFFEN
jgi:predicted CoA-binding protein